MVNVEEYVNIFCMNGKRSKCVVLAGNLRWVCVIVTLFVFIFFSLELILPVESNEK